MEDHTDAATIETPKNISAYVCQFAGLTIRLTFVSFGLCFVAHMLAGAYTGWRYYTVFALCGVAYAFGGLIEFMGDWAIKSEARKAKQERKP